MDSLKLIIFLISIGSSVLAGALSVYWFQFTDEGKKFWRTKIKRLKYGGTSRRRKGSNVF